MKINTDGVLLGALAEVDEPKAILDIGTGTGVMALMLAQRFEQAEVDAVEIDIEAAKTAERNFNASPFNNRLKIYPERFEDFFEQHPEKKYDLIVSNPPFHLNSLRSSDSGKATARHTDRLFFEKLIQQTAQHLTNEGALWLVLPEEAATLIKPLAVEAGLHQSMQIHIRSFAESKPHRFIVSYSKNARQFVEQDFVIYQSPKIYSTQYQAALKSFFTIF
ncbi:methyltransferase [Mucilaginibacter sp. RS28]|uniref:tRNA1(Val) (adenine(37)-N6)-methyltransferase n=2 Tax=Mucilaginibacter straminoryzae TaxID=2932774 RepID=A0A9X1X6B3_9SPHI|nr:methyltransferase [Mucilaginibacter straminoryzae]